MLTLNLLRTSRINPRLSAEEQLNGIFNFNRTPIGPLGTRVVVHEMPDTRAGHIAWVELKKHLAQYGYAPCRYMPGLWKHETRPITFCLVVDDFEVK